jgi:hypothetical protein
MTTRPTLLNSCAHAATAAEARYRIDAPAQQPRATSVVALDEGALALVTDLAGQGWRTGRFLSYAGPPAGDTDGLADVVLRTVDGVPVRLSETLAEVDFVMMIATADGGAAVAAAIGAACTLRGIMTAGVIVGDAGEDGGVGAALAALRPYARVLLVTGDGQDAAELLAAVGG